MHRGSHVSRVSGGGCISSLPRRVHSCVMLGFGKLLFALDGSDQVGELAHLPLHGDEFSVESQFDCFDAS